MNSPARRPHSLFVLLLVAGMVLLGFTMVDPGAAAAQEAESEVAATPDTVPPLIDQPANIYLIATDASGMAVGYAPPAANDAVSGPVLVTCVPQPGSWFPIGTTRVDCSAGDAAGNIAIVSFTVTLEAPAVPTAPPPVEPTVVPTDPPTEEPTAEPTEVPTEEPTEEPTAEPTDEATETPAETEEPAETPSETEEPTEPEATEVPTDIPVTEEPAGPSTPDPSETPTEQPSETPSPSPSPTPVTTPSALPLPGELPPPVNPIYGSGPIDGLSLIWGGLDFPISQEYGHTAFSLSQATLYLYGIGLGMDGRAHPGLDIGMPAGTYLYSPVDGTVIISGGVPYYTYYGNGEPGVGELLIETDSGDEVILGHMAAIAVSAGQRVSTGQFVGLSGGENGDHLHLETRESGLLAVDPRQSFLTDSIAAYSGALDEPMDGAPDVPEGPTVDEETDDETGPTGEGVAVIDEPAVEATTITTEAQQEQTVGTDGSDLLDSFLYEPDSPYGDAKTELIGDMMSEQSVTAGTGFESF